MKKKEIIDANIEKVKDNLSHGDFIENDIVLFDNLKKVPMLDEARRMTFILVALCTRGTARYSVDTVEHEVKQNDIIIISDRHVVNGCQMSDDIEGVAVMLSANYYYDIVRNVKEISQLFLFSRSHPVVTLGDAQVDVFVEYFKLLKKKVAIHNHYRRDVCSALILAMFYDLNNVVYDLQHVDPRKQSRADFIFNEFIRMVEANYKTERRVAWYAEQQCISAKYLAEAVKQVSKRTPNEWIDSYVTLEARVLLKNSSKSIKEISMELNFPNQSFLGKFFKEHVGMSPSEYRRS